LKTKLSFNYVIIWNISS